MSKRRLSVSEDVRYSTAIFDQTSLVAQPWKPVTSRERRFVPAVLFAAALASAALLAQASRLPNRSGSVKFAAIGDNGTGERAQYEVAQQMTKVHATFPFDLVIMLGDNMYGGQTPGDFVRKFEQPYASLLRPA